MGVKHLRKIEEYLRKENRKITRTELRDALQTDWYLVIASLDYLVEKRLIKKEGKHYYVEKHYYVDPRIVDQSRKYTPLIEMIPRVTNQGLTQMKRNECLRLVRTSNRQVNIVRFSESESKPHIEKKQEICEVLKSNGKHFITEAIFKNGKRADILVLDDFEVIEIIHSETKKSIHKKIKEYPNGLKMRLIKC